MQEQEIWKDVVGYEGLYQVSNLGRVKSVARIIYKDCTNHPTIKSDFSKWHRKEVIMVQWKNHNGYYTVSLTKDHKKKTRPVHQLVAKAFIPNPLGKEMINHIDCNTLNNNVNNLEWATNSENQLHAIAHGLKTDIGVNHNLSKLKEEDVRFIREHYKFRDTVYNTRTLGEMFGVSSSVISAIVLGKTYSSVI